MFTTGFREAQLRISMSGLSVVYPTSTTGEDGGLSRPRSVVLAPMIGILTFDNSLARQNVESVEPPPALKSLCEISSREFRAKKMRLCRSVLSTKGEPIQVNLEIELIPGHPVQAGEMADILQRSCGHFFEYALSTSHSKTFVGGLTDAEDHLIGHIVATFRLSAPSETSPLSFKVGLRYGY